MTARSLAIALILAIVPATASAQIATNSKVLTPFKTVVAKANESTVRVYCDGKPAALGTVVFSDGYILTKSSELRGKLKVLLTDGRWEDATIIGRHMESDLALLHVDATDLKPVTFSNSAKIPIGSWLIAAAAYKDATSDEAKVQGDGQGINGVGIVSAQPRELTDEDKMVFNHNRGFLGVKLESTDPKDEDGNPLGAKVMTITDKSAAKKAGMKVGDVIIAMNNLKITGHDALQESLEGTRPDETITLTVIRVDKDKEETEEKLKVKLTGDPFPKSRGDIQNSLGSDLSGRRTGFPAVLQTDLVLEPKNCGGPIIDLKGNVLGIGIARAGRVESWVLPSENIKPLLTDLKSGKFAPITRTTKGEKEEKEK